MMQVYLDLIFFLINLQLLYIYQLDRGTSAGDGGAPGPHVRRDGASNPIAGTNGAPGRTGGGGPRRRPMQIPSEFTARNQAGTFAQVPVFQFAPGLLRRPTSIPAAAQAWRNVSKCRSTAYSDGYGRRPLRPPPC